MDQNPAMKLAAAVAILVGIWVAVYWLWEPSRASQPPISFAPDPAAQTGPAKGSRPPTPAPVPAPDPPRPAPQTSTQVPGPRGQSPAAEPEPPKGSKSAANPKDAAPAPGPKPTGSVKPPQFDQYKVQPGETFETIAKKRYGSSSMSTAIARANPFVDPRRLRAGRVILLPVDPANIQGKVESAPQTPKEGWQTYKVQEGDTLSGISKKFYNTTTLSKKIYDANTDRLKNEHDLKLGLELLIPPPPAPAADAGGEKKPAGDSGR